MIEYVLVAITLLSCIFYTYYNKRRTVVQLLRRQTFYEKMIGVLPEMLIVVDDKLSVLKIYNRNLSRELLSAVAESVGIALSEALSGEANAAFVRAVKQTFASQKGHEEEFVFTIKNEKHYYFCRFVYTDLGYVSCLIRNVDSYKQSEMAAHQNEIMLNNVLDNMPFPVVLKDIDNDLRYIYWNKQCDLLSGFHRSEVLGKTDREIYGEDYEKSEKFRAVDLELLSTGKTYRNHEQYVTPDGALYHTVVVKNIISNDRSNWLLVTRWDVTDLVQMQNSLRLANRQLQLAFAAGNISPWKWNVEEDLVNLTMEKFESLCAGCPSQEQGVSMETFCGRIHPDDRLAMTAALEALQSGSVDRMGLTFRYDVDSNYNNYYKLYMTVESFDGQGKASKVIGSMQNVTKQKKFEQQLILANQQVEQANRTTELILENANIGLVYLSPDYVVQWENLSKYSTHPIARNYATGKCCYRARGLEAPCSGCIMEAALTSGKPQVKVVDLGQDLVVELGATPVWDAQQTCQGIVLRVKDVTQDKRREDDLQEAKERAEKSDKLKSAFLANMSHEIRTPLNAILGFSELLSTTDDPQEKQEYMQVIDSNNELLLQLINDILDLSKIEANTLEFVYTDVDVNVLMGDLERSFQFKLGDSSALEILFEKQLEQCVVYTDRNRLQQVISNFMTNALKFTERGRISFGYELRQESIYFYVTDTGIGIADEKQHDVFKRFTKLNNFKTGTGLGLTICQTIVQKLGGDIGVVSKAGVGSTFWFTIPITALRKSTLEQPDELSDAEQVSMDLFSETTPAVDISFSIDSADSASKVGVFSSEIVSFLELEERVTAGNSALSATETPVAETSVTETSATETPVAETSVNETSATTSEVETPATSTTSTASTFTTGTTTTKNTPLTTVLSSTMISTPDMPTLSPSRTSTTETLSAEEHSTVVTSAEPARENDEKPLLLIAEDTIDNYRLYEVLLKRNYQLLHAWNGQQAVDLFETHRPVAILMDIKMPVMDGYQATALIRKVDQFVPIVAITAFAYAEDKKRIFESGFNDFITKPIHRDQLFEVLAGLI